MNVYLKILSLLVLGVSPITAMGQDGLLFRQSEYVPTAFVGGQASANGFRGGCASLDGESYLMAQGFRMASHFSVSLLVKPPRKAKGPQTLLSRSGEGYGFRLWLDEEGFAYFEYSDRYGEKRRTLGDARLKPDQWNSVILTLKACELSLYANCNRVFLKQIDLNMRGDRAEDTLYIGGRPGQADGFSGLLDETLVFGKAATAQEVQALCAGELPQQAEEKAPVAANRRLPFLSPKPLRVQDTVRVRSEVVEIRIRDEGFLNSNSGEREESLDRVSVGWNGYRLRNSAGDDMDSVLLRQSIGQTLISERIKLKEGANVLRFSLAVKSQRAGRFRPNVQLSAPGSRTPLASKVLQGAEAYDAALVILYGEQAQENPELFEDITAQSPPEDELALHLRARAENPRGYQTWPEGVTLDDRFALLFRLKPDSAMQGRQTLFTQKGGGRSVEAGLSATELFFRYRDDMGNEKELVMPAAIDLGEWNTFALTVGCNEAAAFVNGAPVARMEGVPINFRERQVADLLRLGADAVRRKPFTGQWNEALVYSRPLTESEIGAYHRQTLRWADRASDAPCTPAPHPCPDDPCADCKPEGLEYRKDEIADTVYLAEASGRQVKVHFFDNEEPDGDVISAYIDQKVRDGATWKAVGRQYILREHELTVKPRQVPVTLCGGDTLNCLVLYAHNEGLQPPNTAMIRIAGADFAYDYHLTSETFFNGGVAIRCGAPSNSGSAPERKKKGFFRWLFGSKDE